jgi:hypothetical protein
MPTRSRRSPRLAAAGGREDVAPEKPVTIGDFFQ